MEHFWKYMYSRTYTCLASQQCICVYHCAQLSYTTQHRTVLIMFLPNLQKVRCCLFDTRGVQGGIKKTGSVVIVSKKQVQVTVTIRYGGDSFVCSFVIAGRGPAYSGPQCWDLYVGPMRQPRERRGIGRCKKTGASLLLRYDTIRWRLTWAQKLTGWPA